MEELFNLLVQYAVFPIALVCWGLGRVIKLYVNKIPNRFIPVILAGVGLILNLALNNFTFTFEIIATGIGSGLVATGTYEAIRNLPKKKIEVLDDIVDDILDTKEK